MKTYDDAVRIVQQNMPEYEDGPPSEDEARDIVDALGTHGLLSVAFPPQVQSRCETLRADLDARHAQIAEALSRPTEGPVEYAQRDPRDAYAAAGAGSAAYLNPEGTDFEPLADYLSRSAQESEAMPRE